MTTTLEKNTDESLSIPERALMSVQSKHFVFLVQNGKGEQQTCVRTPVTIGRRIPGFVEILEGLSKDQTIVSGGMTGLTSKSQTRLRNRPKRIVRASKNRVSL